MPALTPLPERLKILLDQNIPVGLKRLLPDYEIIFAGHAGWSELTNDELIKAAEDARFHVSITADGNIRYQQNLTARRLAILWLAGTSNWKVVREHIQDIRAALKDIGSGDFVTLPISDPARRHPRRRLPNGDVGGG